MLGLLSHPDPILPVFEAAAAAERERQRMIAEQRMLMQVGSGGRACSLSWFVFFAEQRMLMRVGRRAAGCAMLWVEFALHAAALFAPRTSTLGSLLG